MAAVRRAGFALSLGLGALVLLLAVIGTWNNGPGLVTAIMAVCLAASVIGFVAAVTSGRRIVDPIAA